MKRETFARIILDFHGKEVPRAVDREIKAHIIRNKAVTVIGPRRAGKTYFLFSLMRRLLGEIEKSRILYVNLEDDRLLPLNIRDMDILIQAYYELYPENKKKTVYLFLDEVQNLPDWEILVRRLMDTEDMQIFLTGSSSKLLAREIATSMRGRSISHYIFPFSFREFLNVKGLRASDYMSSENKALVMNALREYLQFGGFPEIVLNEDINTKISILREYVDIMLMRDIVERHGIKNTMVLRLLFNALLSSFGSLFSLHKFYNILKSQGIKISKNTLYEYLRYIEDAFGIIVVRRFSYSLIKTEQSMPKVYPVDPGYIAQSGSSFSQNIGRLMETVVAIDLARRKYANPLMDFYYWRSSSREVDFVIKEGDRIGELIQVCYDIEDYNTKKREVDALMMASKHLNCKDLRVITWDHEEYGDVKYIPLWKWLME